MSKIKCERGKTMVYQGHYPRLLVTPVFAHDGDFMWVEKIVCMYDANLDDVEEPEFEFHRDTAHYEKNERLRAENAKLRELASELYRQVLQDDAAWHDVRAWEDGLPSDCLHHIRSYDDSLGKHAVAPKFEQHMRELGIEV